MKTFLAQTADQWREWLDEHHDSESEVWLIFHKLHTGVASIRYADALDEALCFGWVDSLVKRLDDRRYARKFTPRRADSRWSTTNRRTKDTLPSATRRYSRVQLCATALRRLPRRFGSFGHEYPG